MRRDLLAGQVALLLAGGHTRQALEFVTKGLAPDSKNVALLNLAGVCAASLGENVQAEHFWRQAIAADPDSAQAHYNLGLLLGKLGREAEAEQSYRQAIAVDPTNAEAQNNLGLLLAREKRGEEAQDCYRRVLALDPHNSRALTNLGVLLTGAHRHAEAETCYRQALADSPADGEILCNLGVLLAEQRRDEEAMQCYAETIRLGPENAAAFSNLGMLLARRRQNDEAERCYRRAIALDPDNSQAHTNLGLLLEDGKRMEEALEHQRLAVSLAPRSAKIHSNLANLLAGFRRWDEAEACYGKAIVLDPDSAALHSNLGVMLVSRKREKEAEQCFRQALALDAEYQLARLNLGFLLLRQARFDEAWAYHEARFDPRLPDNGIAAPKVDFPQWRGEALAGKSLLICSEQGFGDQIQFCRYVPLLKEQGASRITLMCREPLKALMESLQGVDALVSAEEVHIAAAPHDYWTFPLSIPLHFKTRLETIPARIPYLRAPAERIGQWSARIAKGQFNVGLVWQGNVHHHNDAHRSLPSLSVLSPLWSVPGVRFFSLQKDGAPPGQPLFDPGADISDFSDTAAIVENMDLVISVDSAVAHLAGALGKACWLLLPAYRSDWRWLEDRADSPWYPALMRLFRQGDDEDWTPLVAEVRRALKETVLEAT